MDEHRLEHNFPFRKCFFGYIISELSEQSTSVLSRSAKVLVGRCALRCHRTCRRSPRHLDPPEIAVGSEGCPLYLYSIVIKTYVYYMYYIYIYTCIHLKRILKWVKIYKQVPSQYVGVYIYVYTHTQIYMCTYVHVHIHTHIWHAHTPIPTQLPASIPTHPAYLRTCLPNKKVPGWHMHNTKPIV